MRKSSRFAALALTAALALGVATPAFAADYKVGERATDSNLIDPSSAAISKTLKTNEGSTVTATFTYNVAKTTVALSDGTKSYTDVDELPSIAPITLSSDGTGTDKNGTGAITLPTYSHAGVYAYIVSENATTADNITNADGSDGAMVDDTTQYIMRVYVENKSDKSGVEAKSVTFETIDSSAAGETTNGEKKTPTFTNSYTEKTTLEVEKEITGGGANLNDKFNFEVQFTVPEGTLLPAGWKVTDITISGVSATVGNDGKATFQLGDKDKVTFSNIVAGVKYKVVETDANSSGYTTTYDAKGDTELVAQDSGQSTKVTNNKEPLTPTGLILDNAPFLILGATAVAGIVLYGAAKRKLTA